MSRGASRRNPSNISTDDGFRCAQPILRTRRQQGFHRHPQQRDYQRHWTPVHLDFVVEDVHAAVRKATLAGATLEGDIHTCKWGRIAHLADPFGHGICLVEFLGRGYDEIAS